MSRWQDARSKIQEALGAGQTVFEMADREPRIKAKSLEELGASRGTSRGYAKLTLLRLANGESKSRALPHPECTVHYSDDSAKMPLLAE